MVGREASVPWKTWQADNSAIVAIGITRGDEAEVRDVLERVVRNTERLQRRCDTGHVHDGGGVSEVVPDAARRLARIAPPGMATCDYIAGGALIVSLLALCQGPGRSPNVQVSASYRAQRPKSSKNGTGTFLQIDVVLTNRETVAVPIALAEVRSKSWHAGPKGRARR